MKNRIESYQIAEDFSRFSPLGGLDLFNGPQGIQSLIAEFIKQREEKAKKEGMIEAFKKIESEIRRQADNYIILLTRIVDFINKTSKAEFTSSQLKIISSRTNFYLDTSKIDILFVIDASYKHKRSFSALLNEMEKAIFQEDMLIAELFYLNIKDTELDNDSIGCDYPFIRKSEIKV